MQGGFAQLTQIGLQVLPFYKKMSAYWSVTIKHYTRYQSIFQHCNRLTQRFIADKGEVEEFRFRKLL